jgi:hypothetical protein
VIREFIDPMILSEPVDDLDFGKARAKRKQNAFVSTGGF